jgi:hypothetical protein
MEIFKTRDLAEEAKHTNPNYSTSDMTVKVEGGFAIMSARAYINWLMHQ